MLVRGVIVTQHIRSFVRRQGRITAEQKTIWTQLWCLYGLSQVTQAHAIKSFVALQPTVLEIGFGDGTNLIAMAERYPEKNFLGVEVYAAGIGKTLQKISEKNLKNVRLLQGDIIEILSHLHNITFAEIQIFFPDPWPKVRHHKRRLIQSDFITKISQHLCHQGILHCATDWAPYAQHMLQVLSTCTVLKNTSCDFAQRPDTRPLTKFERKALAAQRQIYDLIFIKK